MLFVYGSGLGQGLFGWLVFTGKYRADADGFSVADLNPQFPKKFGCPGEKKRKLSNNVFMPVLPLFCFLGVFFQHFRRLCCWSSVTFFAPIIVFSLGHLTVNNSTHCIFF